MPSNHIYEITEDNNGFLWIGTDNGVSRFDGKRFINYTTKNGLPSNDVIQIAKEKNGTIWANCYKQPPSYFDEKSNRFVSFESNERILKSSRSLLYIQLNPINGIYFHNKNGSLFFKNKKLKSINTKTYRNLFINNIEVNIEPKINKVNNYYFDWYEVFQKDTSIGAIVSPTNEIIKNFIIEKNGFFEVFKNHINYFKIISSHPFRYTLKTIKPAEEIKWYSSSKDEFAVITISGKIQVYDKKTFVLKNTIQTNKEINYYYKDVNNTAWIGSLNNGLLKFNAAKIKSITEFGTLDSNFLSIYINDSNTLFAGNHKGEIFEKGKKSVNKRVKNQKHTTWIRSISSFKNLTITISDMGYCMNYGKNNVLLNEMKHVASLKTAQKLNDSILLFGSNNGLYKLNVFTQSYKWIKSPTERVLSISKINDHSFYFTANSGVFQYDLQDEKYSLFFSNSKLKNDNIQCLESSANGKLWFNTFKGSIYLVKNNTILFNLINSNHLPINSTKLLEIKKELWVASKEGIFILNTFNLPKYSVRKLSKADGLTSNFVNDIVTKNDTVYAATNNGISIIPIALKRKRNNSSPIVISVKINNKNEPVKKSYSLDKDQKNIVLELAGVDLTGHFNAFQYTLNNSKIWYTIEGNILNLVLNGGQNNIEIRAVDENNFISTTKLRIAIEVAIPFYENFLFWIVVAITVSGLTFFYFTRRKLEKQKINFEKQLLLEQQRNKITADLHDDIGATLSSLQINSLVANQLLFTNPNETQKVLKKIEHQSQNLADKIGDIIWSMKPGKDEFLSLSSRIKNFANDILGSTEVNYKIEIDPKVDIEITDITTRKNIVLITKEAINNAAKYSNAMKLTIVIEIKNSNLHVEISDNGIGFDPTKIKGNGITNMQKRALELKGTFNIISNPLSGTTIRVTIPYN